MARAFVEVVGDSASAVRALEATSAAFDATGKSAATAAGEVDAFAASIAKAQATRAETLLAQAGSLRQLSATSAAGSTEQLAANEAALKRQTQAYKLLGIQAATTKASVTQTAGTIGRGLTTYVTAPTAFVGYEAVKQAIDFNQQMLLLKTQAGDASDSIKQLSTEVLKLASSGAPQGPVQLAEGLFHLVSLGLRGAQAMGTLREASLAAGMGMANLEDTSTALGAAVVSGIRGAQNYQQAMATLVGTAGAGNMRFQDLAASIGNVIPSAAAAGVSLHEMGAALAVLTDRGMSAEEAATRLRMSLALMQRPSKQAQAALADMGVNANDLGALIRQPNGLLKVLEVLHTAMDNVGKVRGNRDLLQAFGGARSGIGIQTLVQSLDSTVSSYQGKLAQITQDQQQFATNQQTYLESPAYKLHAALSQVEADLVKLGTSLTPAVTGLAGAISEIANGFSALPGPIKEAMGVIIGILAIGGPVGLAIKGLGMLAGGIGAAFGIAAGEADASLATMGAAADRTAVQMRVLAYTEGQVGVAGAAAGAEVGAGFTAMLGPIAAATAALILMLHYEKQIIAGAADLARKLGANKSQGSQPGPLDFFRHPLRTFFYSPAAHDQQQQENNDSGNYGGGGRGPQGSAAARHRHEHDHHVPGITDAYTSKPTVPGTTAAAATAKAKQQQTQFDQLVHNDQALAQARIDLANGEVAAAQRLLLQDQRRLELMLSEAKTSTERTDVLKQLAVVERLRHSKHDAFALSPQLQEEVAKADAQAALDGHLQGPTARQLQLARQAKAAAMKAINSHMLTLQGLTEAWQIVGQENAIIAQARGAIDTYHAVSSKSIVDSVKGLSQLQQMQLRERIAQAEAHRGYAPNRGEGGQHHTHDVHVHVSSNDSHVVKVVKRHNRGSHQRAGGRR